MKVSRFIVLHFVFLFQVCPCQSQYKFIIFNDIKGELEHYSRDMETDKPTLCAFPGTSCTGGFAKIVQQIDTFRNESDLLETFVLTPGNLVGGESGWLPILGWRRYGDLVRKFYRPNVMSLGMHDFGAGLSRTLEYVKSANTPVVLSNVDCTGVITGDPEREFCNHPLIFTEDVYRLSSKIGLVGFVNPDVMKLSSPGTLRFTEVVSSLNNTIFSSPDNYSTYIAMGDGDLQLAMKIIEQIPQIKLVIYGTAFGNSNDMSGNFPEQSGAGFIATGGHYGSTVGQIVVDINPNGELRVNPENTKLAATNLTVTNKDILNEFYYLEADVRHATILLASTHFKLEGGKECWRRECNFGNLIADAMVHCVLNYPNRLVPSRQAVFAVWHSGAFFQDFVQADSTISTLDIHKWLPYHNRVYLTVILGSKLLQVFERSATGITADTNGTVQDWGQFLQVSDGMEVHYSTSGGYPHVTQIRLLHDSNYSPVMQPLQPDLLYYVVIPSFILEGRSVYDFPETFWELPQSIDFDDTCVLNYVRALRHVAIGNTERILIDTSGSSAGGVYTALIIIANAVVFLVFM